MSAEAIDIPFADGRLSGLWLAPARPAALLVLAHGAGAGMAHRSIAAIADGLAERGVATLRFNFPYMDKGSGRPDPPPVAHAAVRAALAAAATRAPASPLFAGGRSFGARMTSQAEAAAPTGFVKGLVFFAYPLHPAGKPSAARADHLGDVRAPMLFLQGDRDALADLALLKGVVGKLGPQATLFISQAADHSFHAPAKSGRKDAEVLAELLDCARDWMSARL